MLRKKFLIINTIFALVMLLLTIGGTALLLKYVDDQDRFFVQLDTLQEVTEVLEDIPENKLRHIGNYTANLPQGYQLLWVDANGNILANTGIPSAEAKRAVAEAPLQTQEVCVNVSSGIVIVSKGYRNTTLLAVNAQNSLFTVVQRYFTIYSVILAVTLLVVFAGSIAIEMHVVFPRLDKLRHAMDQVYNGNYEQTVRVVPTKHRDEITTLLVDFDMLRRKLRDATLAKEAADRERGIVIMGISHDLRTPLTVIKTHAKGVLDGVAARVGKEHEYVSVIYSTAVEMENLVSKLADFSKVEKHELTYSFVVRDICELIRAFVDKHYIPYAARGLVLKAKLPKNKKLWVSIDKDQFNRVWQNLCDNSLKYKDKPEAHVVISADLMDENVVIRVSDDGPGIADYEVEYVFESYYRGDPSRTNPITGSGLGLSIVKNCVLAHNGQVQAYNHNGLTIEILLPYRRKK